MCKKINIYDRTIKKWQQPIRKIFLKPTSSFSLKKYNEPVLRQLGKTNFPLSKSHDLGQEACILISQTDFKAVVTTEDLSKSIILTEDELKGNAKLGEIQRRGTSFAAESVRLKIQVCDRHEEE